ncbi:MAG: type VII secretion protein EccE [Actinomycetota bacterium]|nr:type VII secretion protein EccE [Actinomycetota bacterium]
MADTPRYRFAPLERRGVLAGLRVSQLVVIASAGLVSVAAARSLSPPGALATFVALVTAAGVVGFVPVSGRTIDEWLPIVASWGLQAVLGRRRFIVCLQSGASRIVGDPQPDLPRPLSGIELLSHPVPGAEAAMGVIKDGRAGTFTAVLSVRGKSFALLDAPDKARRLGSWASVLSSLAREGGAVHRIQWVERTVPEPGDEIGNYLKDNLAVPIDSLIARSYLEVVDDAGPVTQHHETFVALQIHAGRAARAIKSAGGGDVGACEVLRRELTALATKLATAEVRVEGALTPRLVAKAVRTAFDPSCRAQLALVESRDAGRAGTSVVNAGPMAAEATWSAYRTDDSWHRTYWIAEWPRVDAGPDFLAPLLLRTECMRTVAVTMEPVSTLKAIRRVESARTSAAADEELRNRAGFVTTTRRSREHEALASNERDLSDGHAFYQFAGCITVTASSGDELERACGEIEEAAGRSLLDLRPMNGQQDVAFTYTLPLCRGPR